MMLVTCPTASMKTLASAAVPLFRTLMSVGRIEQRAAIYIVRAREGAERVDVAH